MHASHTKTEPPAAAGVPSLPSPTVPVPVPHPDLTDEDKERIETWFEHDSRLTEVAQTLGIGVLTLAAWAKQPHIKDALNDIREIAHFRTETLRAEAEHASVNRLLSLVRYSNHEEIARRAAANILGQGLRPGRAAATGLPPNAPSSPPPPRDPPARRDDTPSIPTPRVPTPPIPTLSPVTQTTSATPNAPATRAAATSPSPFQTSNLKSPPPLLPHLCDISSPPFPVPVPHSAPTPCLSVSVPPCQSPSTPPPSPSTSASPPRSPQPGDNTSAPSPPFPVSAARPAPPDTS